MTAMMLNLVCQHLFYTQLLNLVHTKFIIVTTKSTLGSHPAQAISRLNMHPKFSVLGSNFDESRFLAVPDWGLQSRPF